MTQDFVLGQLRLALVAVLAYAGGKGWLTPADAGLLTALGTSLGPIIVPWAWSIVVNLNGKIVPKNSTAIDISPDIMPAPGNHVQNISARVVG